MSKPRCTFTHRGRPTTPPGTADDAKRISLSQWITRILVRDGDELPGAYLIPGAAGYTPDEMVEAENHYTHLAAPATVPEAELKEQALQLLREGSRQGEIEQLLHIPYSTLVAWREDEKFLAQWEAAREHGKQFQTRSNVQRDALAAPRAPETSQQWLRPAPVKAGEPAPALAPAPIATPSKQDLLQDEVLAGLRSGKSAIELQKSIRGFSAVKLATWRQDSVFKAKWEQAKAEGATKSGKKPRKAPPSKPQPKPRLALIDAQTHVLPNGERVAVTGDGDWAQGGLAQPLRLPSRMRAGEPIPAPPVVEYDEQLVEHLLRLFGKAAVLGWCQCSNFILRMQAGKVPGTAIEQDIEKALWHEAQAEKLC